MQFAIIQTAGEFLNLRGEWNALLESSISDCVFLTHEWLSAWWKHMADGRRLSILTARDGGTLIGILPVAERGAQLARMMPCALEFLGSGVIGSDYLDAIVARGRESEVMAQFADHLHCDGRMLQLSQLRRERCAASLLADQLQRHAWTVVETNLNVCPFIDLRGHTWDTYVATLGPNVRKSIDRYLRNLPHAFDMRVDCVQATNEAQTALEIVVDLHHKRWVREECPKHFSPNPCAHFIENSCSSPPDAAGCGF
jgi:CelD/BcsL family acetyltransferase involved in cellulose biosynthesis